MAGADYLELNAGSGGDKMATDTIGGVKHQEVKVQFGSVGTATDVSSADPLPVVAGYFDTVTGTLVVMQREHYAIHQGYNFRTSSYNSSVSSSGSVVLAFKTPTGTPEIRANFVFGWATGGKGHIQVYKGGSWTGGTGTDLTPVNSNHDSANTSGFLGDASGSFVANKVVEDPTSPTGGTMVWDNYWFSESKSGATGSHNSELLLEPDQTYYIKLTNDEGTAQPCFLSIDWYEAEDAT